MALIGEKSIFSSLTIRGALVVMLPLLLRLFGVDLGDDAAGIISNLVEAGITLVGAFLVIYGRIRATQKVAIEPPI